MGRDRSKQPFYDELIVSNNTGERIKYLSVSYGEMFLVFDLTPSSQIKLLASSEFDRSGTLSNYSLGYSGETESGKKFVDTIENKRRGSFADGRLEFQIMINSQRFKIAQVKRARPDLLYRLTSFRAARSLTTYPAIRLSC